jgi:hypothetical protein
LEIYGYLMRRNADLPSQIRCPASCHLPHALAAGAVCGLTIMAEHTRPSAGAGHADVRRAAHSRRLWIFGNNLPDKKWSIQ